MIHSTAEISSGTTLGKNVALWHYVQVREGVSIGDNTTLGKNVYVDKNVVIGANCKIQNNCSVYQGVTIESGVFVGPHCVFTNDKMPRAINSDGTLKQQTDWQVEKTLVKEGASLGARAVVLPGLTIGRFALVGAGSVVTKDVPDYGLVYGSPARLQGWVCQCGQRLEQEKVGGELCVSCEKKRQ